MNLRTERIVAGVLAGAFGLPLALLVYLSVSAQWHYPALAGHLLTLQHWRWMLSGSPLLASLGLSLGLSLTVGAIATGLGAFVSRLLAYYTHSSYWLLGAYAPYVIAPVVLGVMLNVYLLRLGLTGTIGGVASAQLLITVPYAILLFYGFWNERLRTMEHLVRTMGGDATAVLRHAIWPAARGLLAVCFFQTFLISWFEYGLTQYIGVGKVPTLTIMVFRYVSEANPYLAALASVLLVAPPLALLALNRRVLVQRIWHTAQ